MNESVRKVFHTVQRIAFWAVVVFAVCVMIFTIVAVTTFDRYDRNVFGFKAFIVTSDSMKATDFAAGDIIFSKVVDPTTLAEGDIITFRSANPDNYGEIITHKIRSKTIDSYGDPAFVTYGTTTDTDDEMPVSYPYILGKYQGRIPLVGKFFAFLKTPAGYVLFILLPFMTLILVQGINTIRLFRRYKSEQFAAMEAERNKIEEERAEAQRMMAELLELKKQLSGNSSPSPTENTPPPENASADETQKSDSSEN